MRDAEFIVIGAGVMGSATAWSLSKEGREVVLLERFEIGHDRGSSHGRSRVFRFSYEEPTFVRMAMEALPLWREIEQESRTQLLRFSGGFDFGGDITPNIAALEQCGASFEVLEPPAVAERFPAISLPQDQPALFQADAGIVTADQAMQAFAAAGKERGVELREHTPALRLNLRGGGAEIQTEDEALRAQTVVVTAGAWSKALLRPIDMELPVVPTRETVAYFRHDREMELPVMIDRDSLVYSLPDPGWGVKAGAHHAGPPTDPDQPGSVSSETVEALAAWVAQHYPNADPRPHHAETCIYTNTADERFILERHGSVVVGSACSGHGFKFAPLIGKRLAELARR